MIRNKKIYPVEVVNAIMRRTNKKNSNTRKKPNVEEHEKKKSEIYLPEKWGVDELRHAFRICLQEVLK